MTEVMSDNPVLHDLLENHNIEWRLRVDTHNTADLECLSSFSIVSSSYDVILTVYYSLLLSTLYKNWANFTHLTDSDYDETRNWRMLILMMAIGDH